MKFKYLVKIILVIFFGFVVAPPPLDIELKAEKEQNRTAEKTDIIIDHGNDQLYLKQGDKEVLSIDSNIVNLPDSVAIIEDPKEIERLAGKNKIDAGEIVGEFRRIELPTNFNEYDVNGDGYIDLDELIDATEAEENAKSAFADSDINGDGKISKAEFMYWFPDGTTIDISDELNNYGSDDKSNNDEVSDEVDKDTNVDEIVGYENEDEDEDDDDEDESDNKLDADKDDESDEEEENDDVDEEIYENNTPVNDEKSKIVYEVDNQGK